MKRLTYHIPLLLLFCFLGGAEKAMAQCTLTANFSTLALPGGQVAVASTGGTNNTAVYYWSFGSIATPSYITGSASTATTAYASGGTYTISLMIITATPSCSYSKTDTVVVNTSTVSNPCVPSLTYYNGANGAVYFTAGTPSASPSGTLNWNFGNGVTSTGTSTLSTVTYSANGTYTVNLTYNVYNPSACSGSTFVVVTVTNVPVSCTPTLTYVMGPAGSVHYTLTPPGNMLNGTTYWDLGNAPPVYFNSLVDSTVYLSNGTYYISVTYSVTNPIACSSTVMDTILITNAGCNLTASLVASSPSGTNTTVSFTNLSTGMTSIATVTLNYGDGSPLYIGPASSALGSHTYSSTGTYLVIFKIYNQSTTYCANTAYLPVVIGNTAVPCGLTASFTYSNTSLGNYYFMSTSVGASSNATYSWDFGDSTGIQSSNSLLAPHQYSTTGIKFITLSVNNNSTPYCANSSPPQLISVPCVLTASFSHTVMGGGVVDFESTTSGALLGTSYFWIFGDGSSSSGSSVTHTYINAGAYEVKLMASDAGACTDSTAEFLNVTGITCTPNAYFTLSPSGIPQYWDATPSYPWNVTDASWDWGDGSMSDSLYTSHSYSTAGTYSICLSVTVSCGGGATGTECSSYAIFRTQQGAQDQSIIYVNVKRPSQVTGISAITADESAQALYPNPNTGIFQVKLDGLGQHPVNISICNLLGKQIYSSTEEPSGSSLEKNIYLEEAANGVYFVRVTSDNLYFTKKMIINK